MQFEANKTNRLFGSQCTLGSTTSSDDNPYEFCITFYSEPPFGKLSLEDGEDMVSERLSRKYCHN